MRNESGSQSLVVLRNWPLIAVMAVFALHQVLQYVFHIRIPFLNNYYDMFAFGVMLPSLYLAEKHFFRPGKPERRVSPVELLAIAIVATFATEVIYPAFSGNFTGDLADVPAFLAGAAFFVWFVNSK